MGKAWMNSSVCVFTDKEDLVTVINKQSSKEPAVMTLLRKLILTCLRYNINLTLIKKIYQDCMMIASKLTGNS